MNQCSWWLRPGLNSTLSLCCAQFNIEGPVEYESSHSTQFLT